MGLEEAGRAKGRQLRHEEVFGTSGRYGRQMGSG